MKITDISTTVLFYPHTQPVQNPTISTPTTGRRQLFVHIYTDELLEGLGIGLAWPGVQQIVENLKNLLVGKDPVNTEKLWGDMSRYARNYGHDGIASCAISAVDIGLWDLKAKILDLPLYKLLGAHTESVPIYGSEGCTNSTEKELLDEMAAYVDEGMSRVKIKVGKDFGRSERQDIERIAAVRKALGDDIAIYVDATNGYYRKQAVYMAREFEQHQVGWLEEPIMPEDLKGMAEITHCSDIPIAAGANAYTKQRFRDLMEWTGVDIVQPDIARVGGVTEWLKVAHMAEAFNLPVTPNEMQLVHLHVACAIPNLKVLEYMKTDLEVDKLWYTEIPEQKNGYLSPFSNKPGLGLQLDHYSISQWRV